MIFILLKGYKKKQRLHGRDLHVAYKDEICDVILYRKSFLTTALNSKARDSDLLWRMWKRLSEVRPGLP